MQMKTGDRMKLQTSSADCDAWIPRAFSCQSRQWHDWVTSVGLNGQTAAMRQNPFPLILFSRVFKGRVYLISNYLCKMCPHHLKPHGRPWLPLILLLAEISLKDWFSLEFGPISFKSSLDQSFSFCIFYELLISCCTHFINEIYTYIKHFHFLNRIAGLQLKSKDDRFPRSHFPDVGHHTWKQSKKE